MAILFTRIITLQNPNYDNTKEINLDRLLRFILIESITGGGNKFVMLKKLILENKFLREKDIVGVIDCFCNAQRVLHSLMRICRKVNYKYSRTYDYNLDMAMIPLNQYKPHLIITLLENNTKYNFKLGDMITLIHKRLCNSNSFFPEPLDIVNPYTNIPLSYSSLYKLYFAIKTSNFTMPTLFHQLFLCQFDLGQFLDFNECIIKENIITEANHTATQRQKTKRLSAMMYLYRSHFSYRDYLDNYNVVLEKISYLHIHYLRTKYSLNPNVRFMSERTIKSALRRLRTEFSGVKSKNRYRRPAPDIGPSSRQNNFLFGQHNEIYDETENEDYQDDQHYEDDEVDELDNTYHHDEESGDDQNEETIIAEQTLTMTTELVNGSYQINTDVISEWLNTLTQDTTHLTADATSEIGDNTDGYDAVISITPTSEETQLETTSTSGGDI